MGGALPRRIAALWDVLVGSDPGLLRLRLGLRAAIALALVVGVENLVAPRVGIPTVVAILLGGMVAMNGSFAASSRPPRDATITLAFFPLAAGSGALAGSLVAGHRLAGLVTFVAVMVAAVYVRRFGPRGFQYGMIGWLSYFFTMFVGFRLGQLGDVMAVITSAAGCVMVAAILLIPDRAAAAYLAARRAFDIRVGALAETARDALAGEVAAARVHAVLHARSFRVVEAALIVDGHLSSLPPAPGQQERRSATRHGLLDVELAAEELATATGQLALVGNVPEPLRSALLAALGAVQRSDLALARGQVAELARRIADMSEDLPLVLGRQLRDARRALSQLLDGLEACAHESSLAVPAHVREFRPAVELFLGNLPSTSPTAVAAISDGATWWARRSLNTRLCIQVALAGSVSVFAGDLVSGRRYYWAVLACFLALTGTFTTGEIAVKGINRIVGTFAGLLVATVTVHLTGRDDTAIVAVVLVCVFLGLYFFRVSYAVMAFAITTIMGQLYNVLHEFSDQLLWLRLVETALGAGVGILVALLVLPVRTADARASAIDAFIAELRVLTTDVHRRLSTGVRDRDLFLDARRVDRQLHQLALVALPAGGQTLIGLSGRRASRRLVPFTEIAYCARALAAAVAEWSLRCGPEHDGARGRQLAGSMTPLLDKLSRVRATDGIEPAVAVLADVGEELRLLRREVDRATRAAASGAAAADQRTGGQGQALARPCAESATGRSSPA